jgi:tRNA A37 threonylcarbamoyladenosine synthetase subunit TsaC/SUA5/YrdC
MAPATDADAAEEMLGESVGIIIDAGQTPGAGAGASTIIDATGEQPRLLRAGALSTERINEVLAPLDLTLDEED